MAKQTKGSIGSQQGYNRLVSEFGRQGTATATAVQTAAGTPGSTLPPVSDAAPFVANAVLDKVLVLALVALACGIGSAFLKVSVGWAFVAMLASAGCYFIGFFKPNAARITAPLYAVLIGIALGVLSGFYSHGSATVVPLAIAGTTAVFFATLFMYRTGIVRVSTSFVRATMIAGIGLIVAMLVAFIVGMHTSAGHQSLLYIIIFGYLYLVVGVMSLFVDIAYLYQAEQAGVSKQGEWFGAQMVLASMVMIYLALLTIFGGNR